MILRGISSIKKKIGLYIKSVVCTIISSVYTNEIKEKIAIPKKYKSNLILVQDASATAKRS